MFDAVNLPVNEITTEILRNYLADYKSNSKAGMVTIDNIRRTLSSFFVWLENEDYIVKSPVRRIHKVKTTRKVKETLTDENLEKLRDTCSNVRDLAILELLISTGMRVGEITRLNISDVIDFSQEVKKYGIGIVVTGGEKAKKMMIDENTYTELSNRAYEYSARNSNKNYLKIIQDSYDMKKKEKKLADRIKVKPIQHNEQLPQKRQERNGVEKDENSNSQYLGNL